MKLTAVRTLLMSLSLLLFSGCADPDFMDKTVLARSLLQAEKVQASSTLAKKVVLVVQHLEIKNKSVSMFGLCTGVVVGPKTILTAAHCLKNGTARMKVILNVNPRSGLADDETDIYSVVDNEVHPGYRSFDKDLDTLEELQQNPDLALLYVDRNLDHFEALTTLPDYASYINTKSILNITIAGFGKTTALKDTSHLAITELNGVLKKATIQVPTAVLKESYFALDQKESAGICHGDSGAPLFLEVNNKSYVFALAIGVFRKHNSVGDYKNKKLVTDCSENGMYINLNRYKIWLQNSLTELTLRNQD